MNFLVMFSALFLHISLTGRFPWFCMTKVLMLLLLIFGPTLFLLCINELVDLTCDIAIYAVDTTLCSKYDRFSDLCQQLQVASKLQGCVT